MNIYKERPNTEMLPREERTYAFLEKLGIKYDILYHDVAETMEICEQIENTLGTKIVKNLLLCNSQKTNFYLLMMSGEKKFITKDFSKQLGVARLSFADGAFMEEFLDITPGSLSVMGMMNDNENKVRLCIDSDILKLDDIGIHPCVNTASMRVKVKDITEIFLPAVAHRFTEVTL